MTFISYMIFIYFSLLLYTIEYIFINENKRILLTYDRGFGDIFRFNISKSRGVIIVLTSKMKKNEIINIILSFMSTINKQADLRGKLVIIGKSKIRITKR